MVKAAPPEGEMLTVELHEHGRACGFVPHRSSSGLSSFEVSVYRLQDAGDPDPEKSLLGLIGPNTTERSATPWGEPRTVTITGVGSARAGSDDRSNHGSPSLLDATGICLRKPIVAA